MSVGSDCLDKLDECVAGLWDAMLRPWGVVKVANQDVVSMLHRNKKKKKGQSGEKIGQWVFALRDFRSLYLEQIRDLQTQFHSFTAKISDTIKKYSFSKVDN